jgi:hypothetical protein
MQYKISFIDNNGEEFMGTTECFTTDGRYNLTTVHAIATDTMLKAYKRENISGYNVRLNSFNNPIVKTVLF